MLKSGNSEPMLCVGNLIKTIQGEVPYMREKGIPRESIDVPVSAGQAPFKVAVKRLIDEYEPRVDSGEIDMTDVGTAFGNFEYDTYVSKK